jgi:hypothetical protein
VSEPADTLSQLIPDQDRVGATSAGGVLAGVWYGPRPVAKVAHAAGFRDDDLFMAVAICGSESWLYTKAYNDNFVDGVVISRDVGLWQINIPASQIGTSAETALYDPEHNASAAFWLWKNRGWEPWVGFTSNAYLHNTYHLWGVLGCGNRWSEIITNRAAVVGYTSTAVKVPAISIPTARTLWPSVPLG